MPPRAIDRVSISFGLVAIPARIYSTGEPGSGVSFHLVHAACGSRVKQQWYCPKDEEVVERADLVKGYELGSGKLVTFAAEELKALEAVSTDTIEIREFVPLAAIDPIYYEKHYYLGPDKGGDRAYALLRAAMRAADQVAIGTYAARGKQYLVALRPDEHGIVLHQLRYPREVRAWGKIEVAPRAKPAAAELALAEKVIAQLAKDEADLDAYKDEVTARVEELIEQKAEGEAIEMPEPPARPEKLTDLVAQLRESLGATAKPARRSGSRKANGHAARPHRPRRAAAATAKAAPRAHRKPAARAHKKSASA
jgi:DNA end-binding protein Ku